MLNPHCLLCLVLFNFHMCLQSGPRDWPPPPPLTLRLTVKIPFFGRLPKACMIDLLLNSVYESTSIYHLGFLNSFWNRCTDLWHFFFKVDEMEGHRMHLHLWSIPVCSLTFKFNPFFINISLVETICRCSPWKVMHPILTSIVAQYLLSLCWSLQAVPYPS